MNKVVSLNDMKLKFDHTDYQIFLDEDDQSKNNWYAVSIQLDNSSLQEIGEMYMRLKNLFSMLIANVESETVWYILHDDKILPWFISEKESKRFPKILSILKCDNKEYYDKGIFICSTAQLESLCSEIVRYPSELSYKNIDCINSKTNIILKTTSHLTLDLISTNEETLKIYCNKIKSVKGIIIKKYNTLN